LIFEEILSFDNKLKISDASFLSYYICIFLMESLETHELPSVMSAKVENIKSVNKTFDLSDLNWNIYFFQTKN